MLLYSYCITFKINPEEAKNTPMKLMMEMLQIHGETEAYKAEEIQKKVKR
tara:strand:+ start:482 stop:631 length:150 start_codon:yes stop_codon:yes gene_type:complete